MRWIEEHYVLCISFVMLLTLVAADYNHGIKTEKVHAEVQASFKLVRAASLNSVDEEISKTHQAPYHKALVQYRDCVDDIGGLFALDEAGDCVAPAIATATELGGEAMTIYSILAVVRERACHEVGLAQLRVFPS